MTDLRKAAKMALEALLNYPLTKGRAIQALRQALAQPDETETLKRCLFQMQEAAKALAQPEPIKVLDSGIGKWLTVVYKDVQAGDEVRQIIEHPKMSAVSWTHAINDRDAALAQPANQSDCGHKEYEPLCQMCMATKQNPVAWVESLEKPQPRCVTNLKYRSVAEVDAGVQYIPLYTATPEQWVELTDSEILEIEQDSKVFDYLIPHLFARSIETKLKEKNT